MATFDIFVSFEFDRDNDLKNNFFRQAKKNSQHRVRNCSLKEAYPDQGWQQKARTAIEECDVVVILIGQDTHNAAGIKTEVRIARRLNKPIIQVRPQKRSYTGFPGVEDAIPWRWRRLNQRLDALANT